LVPCVFPHADGSVSHRRGATSGTGGLVQTSFDLGGILWQECFEGSVKKRQCHILNIPTRAARMGTKRVQPYAYEWELQFVLCQHCLSLVDELGIGLFSTCCSNPATRVFVCELHGLSSNFQCDMRVLGITHLGV
jgi:hypothetical protein